MNTAARPVDPAAPLAFSCFVRDYLGCGITRRYGFFAS